MEYRLYEALLWDPPRGYFLLERHLARLERSARELGFALDVPQVRKLLEEYGSRLAEPRKVRAELSRDGSLLIEDHEVRPGSAVRVALAREPVSSADERLRHKTSRRELYERTLAEHPAVQDVLLWNERRELTESCSSNVVLELDGRKLTPHHACGLLPGTFRAELLARGEIEEAVLPIDSLERASRIFTVNSVRRWVAAELVR
jgi:para-aminobenzoate synthetase/4-amino-4-deoxychorismate lyase